MRRIALLLAILLLLAIQAAAQSSSNTAFRIRRGDVLPATCSVADVFYMTPGVSGTIQQYDCTATNVWTIISSGGGSGTVTVVGSGNLTSTALVTGGGSQTVQTPSATATLDASGNLSTPGGVSTGVGGSVAGTLELTQGTAPLLGTTSVKIYAPTSVTSYAVVLPAASATGFMLGTNAANVNTITYVGFSGTGNVARVNTPSFTTPDIGAATGTSLNLSGLTASRPVITDGSKNLASGTYSGNTTTIATTSGTLTSGNCVKFDASGNLVDSGGTCGGASGANTDLGNLASVAINTDLLPASNQSLGSATKPFLSSFTGTTTQYEKVSQAAGVIKYEALGSATDIGFTFTAKGAGPFIFTGTNGSFYSDGRISFNSTITGNYALFGTSTQTIINAPTGTFIGLRDGNTEFMRLLSATTQVGNSYLFNWGTLGGTQDLGIGRNAANIFEINTGAAGSISGSTVKVGNVVIVGTTDATSTTTGALQNPGGLSVVKRVFFGGLSSDAGATDATVCRDTTSKELLVGSGTLGVCLGTSSARYKRDIEDMRAGLPEILGLRPVNFYYDPRHGDGGARLQYGFTAEQMQPVLPGLVHLDAQGRPNAVDLLGLVPVLVRAMQQQQAEIVELRETVRRLQFLSGK